MCVYGGAGESDVGEELDGEAGLGRGGRSGSGTHWGCGSWGSSGDPKSTGRSGCATGAESRGGDWDGAGFGDGSAHGGGDFGVGETVADAGEDGGVLRGSAVVVAEEDVEGIGGGADDGDGFYGGF